METLSEYLENNVSDTSTEVDENGYTVEKHTIGEIKKQVSEVIKMRMKNDPSIPQEVYGELCDFAMDLVFEEQEWRGKPDDEVVSVQSVLMDFYIREPLNENN